MIMSENRHFFIEMKISSLGVCLFSGLLHLSGQEGNNFSASLDKFQWADQKIIRSISLRHIPLKRSKNQGKKEVI